MGRERLTLRAKDTKNCLQIFGTNCIVHVGIDPNRLSGLGISVRLENSLYKPAFTIAARHRCQRAALTTAGWLYKAHSSTQPTIAAGLFLFTTHSLLDLSCAFGNESYESLVGYIIFSLIARILGAVSPPDCGPCAGRFGARSFHIFLKHNWLLNVER
jgi:hypothetical protein